MEKIPRSKINEIMNPRGPWSESQRMRFVKDMQAKKVAVDKKKKP